MRKGSAEGFSLVEMIVSMVVVACLGTALYATLAQGVRLWTRASKDRGEWRADLWLEKMTEDLRNTFQDPKWPFRGTRTALFFSTLVYGSDPKGSGLIPVYFHYAFDPRIKAIIFQKYDLVRVLASRPEGSVSGTALGALTGLELEYLGYDAKIKAYQWESEWNKDCFPAAVKITIKPENINPRKWVQTIPMPAGSVCSA